MAISELVGSAGTDSRLAPLPLLLRTVSLACRSLIERERKRELDAAMRRLDHTSAREDYTECVPEASL